MTTEGLDALYPKDLPMLDPTPLDAYLSNLPGTDTFNAPSEITKNPGTIADRLAAVTAAARLIETERRLIAWHGSVLAAAVRLHPTILDTLPEDERRQAQELIGRMALENNDD
jgi:hypothetical protein